jgi:hypothetical protein
MNRSPFGGRLNSALAGEIEPAMMTVFELFYPGTWIELEDRDVGFEVSNYLSSIESRFTDAAVLLGLFVQAQAKVTADLKSDIELATRPRQSDAAMRSQLEPCMDPRAFLLEWTKKHVEAKRQRWQAGELLGAYTSRLFVHLCPSFSVLYMGRGKAVEQDRQVPTHLE